VTLLASDNFNRTNANPIGGVWTTTTSEAAFQLTSNTAAAASVSSDSGCRWTGPTFPNDQWVQARITVNSTTNGTGMGIVARCASGARTYYRATFNHKATLNVQLEKFVAGTFTQLWTRTATFTDGDLCRLECRGTTLRVLINGVPQGADQTDSAVTAGNPGMCQSSIITSGSIDEWCAGSFDGNEYTLIQQQALNRSYLW